jgi:primary-amine oxidase
MRTRRVVFIIGLPSLILSQELLGGLPNDTIVAGGAGPFGFDGSFRRFWLNWQRDTPGFWLHPLNLWQYVDVSGTDPSKWDQLKVNSLSVLVNVLVLSPLDRVQSSSI